jgi:hypothetical protein
LAAPRVLAFGARVICRQEKKKNLGAGPKFVQSRDLTPRVSLLI